MEEKSLQVITGPEDFYSNFWVINDFYEMYPEDTPYKNYSLISMANDSKMINSDNMSLIVFRSFIEDSPRLRRGQKYILAIRFYSFGDMMTIDLISLDLEYHKDIAFEHLNRLGWSLREEESVSFDKLSETETSPFLFIGGYVAVKKNHGLIFSGSSADYGSDVFLHDGNDMANFISTSLGFPCRGNISNGKSFTQELSEFMMNNKSEKDFYERFFQHIKDKNPGHMRHFKGNHLSSLMFMKAADRSVTEEKSFIELSVEEVSTGFGRFALLSSVAKKIKDQK